MERRSRGPQISAGRWASLALLFAVLYLYMLVERVGRGGVALRLPVDGLIPVWPVWVVPYLLVPILWQVGLLWAAWRMPGRLYRSFALALLGVMLASEAFFILYPTYIVRPAVSGAGWTADLLRYLYSVDGTYNAFPSGHIYISVVFAFFWSYWHPRTRWLWGAALPVVALSTLFTHQHYLLDLVGGLVAGALACQLSWWWVMERRVSASVSP
jgi:membrane-associated phospholipid phosphatase